MGVLAAIVVFPLETRHLVPPLFQPTLELFVLQTALLPYIYKPWFVASSRFRSFSPFPLFLSLSFFARENSRVREEQRRVEPGKEKRNGKTKLNIPKGIGGVDRRTGERGLRVEEDEKRWNRSAQPSSTAHRGSAGTRDVQCPGCINTSRMQRGSLCRLPAANRSGSRFQNSREYQSAGLTSGEILTHYRIEGGR